MFPGAHAQTTPDKAAIVMAESGETMSFSELHEFAEKLANLFWEAGFEPGDHVAFSLENRVEFLPVCWGAHYAGLYYTAISTRLNASEMAYIIEDSGARGLIMSSGLAAAPELIEMIDSVELRLSLGGSVDGYQQLEDLLESQPVEPVGPRREGNDMLYSSGTTGQPKGVKVSVPETELGEADNVTNLLALLFGATSESTYLSPAPLYHAAGLRFCRAMHRLGATVVVMERFDAEAMLAAIERQAVTFVQVVPTMFVRMLKLEDSARDRYDVSSLECVVHAAAPCPVPVKHQMIEWWGPIIHEYYAGTEGNGFCYCNSEQWLEHPGTVGAPIMGALHIVGDDLEEVPTGETGMVYFESDSSFEYHNDPQKTAESRLSNGWSTLGDIGRVDDDGYLYLTDRKAFTIISGGVNVYPQEAENVLTTHPKVLDVAVFGIPDDDLGEQVKAVVQPVDWSDIGPELEQDLLEFCRSHLASVKCPRSVDFLEQLPRHPTGKLYKRLLRDEYWPSSHG